jgi:hypothetical protein
MKRKQSCHPQSPKNKKIKQVNNGSVTTAEGNKSLLSNENVLVNILSYLDVEDVIQRASLVCRTFASLSYLGVRKLILSSDCVHFDDVDHFLNVIKKMKNVVSICIDGFDGENDDENDGFSNIIFTEEVLTRLLQMAYVHNSKLVELDIRQCSMSGISIRDDKQLQILRLDNLFLPEGLQIESSTLHTIEFYSCDILKPSFSSWSQSSQSQSCGSYESGSIQFSRCYNLQNLKFFKCKNFTDKVLYLFLKNFLPDYITRKGQQLRARKTNVTKVTGSDMLMNNSEKVEEEQKFKLRHLYICECEPLMNPVIQSFTLEDIRIINCKYLQNPFISCNHLKRLQLNWCQNLENLTLASGNLELLDLTGIKTDSSTVQNIVTAVKQFCDKIQVLY